MKMKFVIGLLLAFFINPTFAGIFTYQAVNQWPGGIVLYDDISALPIAKQNEIIMAMNAWSSKTVIKFQLSQPNSPRSLVFDVTDNGCGTGTISPTQVKAWVGGCNLAGVIHELGHIIGLAHEQNRTDRDFYIDMDQNTWDGQVLIGSDAFDYGPYDIDSIMMYGMYQKDGTVKGGAQTISEGDIATVNAHYADAFSIYDGSIWTSGIISQSVIQLQPVQGIKLFNDALPAGATINYQVFTDGQGWSAAAQNGQVLLFPVMQDFTAWLDNAPGYSVQYSIRVGNNWRPWQADGRYAAEKHQRDVITGFRFRIKAAQKLMSDIGFCIDIFQNNTYVNGTNASMWHCHGKAEQQFEFATHSQIPLLVRSAPGVTPLVQETGLQIKTINNKCLITQNNSLAIGANVEIGSCCLQGQSCTPDPRTFWFIDKDNQIKNYANPERCLRVVSNSVGANLELNTCLLNVSDRMFSINSTP